MERVRQIGDATPRTRAEAEPILAKRSSIPFLISTSRFSEEHGYSSLRPGQSAGQPILGDLHYVKSPKKRNGLVGPTSPKSSRKLQPYENAKNVSALHSLPSQPSALLQRRSKTKTKEAPSGAFFAIGILTVRCLRVRALHSDTTATEHFFLPL